MTQDAGTDEEAIDFGDSPEGDADASANPDAGENTQDDGEEQTPGHRSLAELHQAFKEGEDISDAENDRILLAAKRGLKTDEEIDAYLKTKGQKPLEKDTGKKPLAEKPVLEPAKAKPKEKVPDDPLARLVREINPTKPDPEEALRSYQTLKSDYRKKGERLNTLDATAKQIGFENVEQVIERASKMEERIVQLLKTPAGRKQLLEAYRDELGDVVNEPFVPAKGEKAPPELEDLDDEEFPQGSKIKAHMAKLAQDIEARIEAAYAAKYGEVEKDFGVIKTKIQQDESNRETQNVRVHAMRDAADIASYYGQFDPEYALQTPADKIFAESTQAVYQNGALVYLPKKNPHPEWPTLRRILEFRKEKYSAQRDGTIRNWIGGMMLEDGKLGELKTQAAKEARTKLLTNQRKALQPALIGKGRAQPMDSFKVPESTDDVEAMTTEQQREFRRQLLAGDLKVRTT